jgi:glutathione S-transferase
MLKIWGRDTSSNVMKVVWTCAEIGLPFERYDVGGPYGGNDTPDYLALNPNGLVPTIDDDGFVLWESHSIVRYLAAKHDRLLPHGLQARADAERWMDWQLTVLGPAYVPIFFQLVRTPAAERSQAVIDTAIEKSAKGFEILEKRLEGRSYLCGDQLTVADIPYAAILHRWFTLEFRRPSFPNVEGWYRRLCEREGFRKHVVDVPMA